MSVALRSCASRTLLSFSGWEERDGGERSRVRGSELDFDVIAEEGLKSGVVSRVTAGAMVTGKIAVAERTEQEQSTQGEPMR